MFNSYYLFQNKEKEKVKVFTKTDILPGELQQLRKVPPEYKFIGIFEKGTDKLLAREVVIPTEE